MHTKKLLYNYYFLQHCCANLWGGSLNGDFIQFTVTLYKSYKLIFLKHRGCRHQEVWKYGACTSFYSLIIAVWMLAISLCVLPVHRVCGGFLHAIHLYHFGFELPVYTLWSYCNFMQICQFWLRLSEERWNMWGYLHCPSLLVYLWCCKSHSLVPIQSWSHREFVHWQWWALHHTSCR